MDLQEVLPILTYHDLEALEKFLSTILTALEWLEKHEKRKAEKERLREEVSFFSRYFSFYITSSCLIMPMSEPTVPVSLFR